MPGPWEKYAGAKAAPWEKYAAAAPAPQGDATGAAIEGFGQGASMGYLAHLQALLGQLAPNPSADVDAKLKAEGFKLNQGDDSYLQMRDENLARQEALSKSNPYIYGGSQLAGIVATAPLAEMGAARLMPAAVNASRLGRAVSTGATIGAIQNPGDVAGEISPLQLEDRGSNALMGAAVGAGGDLLARGAEKGLRSIKNLGPALREAGEANALRSAGAQKSQINKLDRKGRTKEVADFVLENDLHDSGLSGTDLQKRVQSLKSEASAEIGNVLGELEKAGEKGAFNRKELAEKMRTTLLEDVGESIDADTLLPKFEKYIIDFEKKAGPATAKEVQGLRQQFDDRVNFSKRQGDLSENEAVFKRWRRMFSEEVSKKADEIGGEAGNRLRAANKKYSMSAEVGKLADNKKAQEGNNAFGLSDRIAGATFGAANAMRGENPMDMAQNGLMGALLGAGSSKLARTYGPSIATRGLIGAGNAISRVAPVAGAIESAAAPTVNRLRLKALESDKEAPRKKISKEAMRRRLKAMGD